MMMNRIKRKIPQCVLLLFAIMTVLNGCGSVDQDKKNDSETVSAEQNGQKTYSDMEEENPETMKTEETKTEEQGTEDSETKEDGGAQEEENTGDDEGEINAKQQEIPDWKSAYLEFLTGDGEIENCAGEMVKINELTNFQIAYVDDDEIPELFYEEPLGPGLLGFRDGEVINLSAFGRNEVWYQEKTGKLVTYFEYIAGSSYLWEACLTDGELKQLVSASADVPEEGRHQWIWNDEEISQEKYELRRDEILGQMTHCFGNGMSFDEICKELGKDMAESNVTQEAGNSLLKEVTWEDFNDGAGEPVLHFSFNNGTVIDKKLQYLGIVQNVQYMDITGDGVDEIVVDTDMINTVRDDFTILDFFRIEGDTVEDISPFHDIPELKDTAWCMEISQEPFNDCTIVLDMESYGKMAGVSYIDCMMKIGFDGSGWKVISKQERPEG